MQCLQLSYILGNIFTGILFFYFSLLVKFRHACRYTEGVMTFYVCLNVSLYGSEDVVGDFKREILLNFTLKFIKML